MRIRLAKPEFRFALAHFTLFDDGERERLHGHNYTVSMEIDLDRNAPLISFATWKLPLKHVLVAWDERVLVPQKNSALCVSSDLARKSCTLIIGDDEYRFPERDLLRLPIENATCECLADQFLAAWLSNLNEQTPGVVTHVRAVTVWLEETPGQGAQAHRDWPELAGEERFCVSFVQSLSAVHALQEREEPHAHTWDFEWSFWTPVSQRMDGSILKQRLSEKIALLEGKSLHSDPFVPEEVRQEPSTEQLAIWARRGALEIEREFPKALKFKDVTVRLLDPDPVPWIRITLSR